jgi:hypothetical protein
MTDTFSPELRKALRQLKLTPVLDTLNCPGFDGDSIPWE